LILGNSYRLPEGAGHDLDLQLYWRVFAEMIMDGGCRMSGTKDAGTRCCCDRHGLDVTRKLLPPFITGCHAIGTGPSDQIHSGAVSKLADGVRMDGITQLARL